MIRVALPLLTALSIALGAVAPARASFDLVADSTQEPGQINFFIWGSEPFASVDISERVDGVDVPVRTVTPRQATAPDGTPFTADYIANVTPWRCDRTRRLFTAVARRADGSVAVSDSDLRTPSCRNRLALVAPRRVRPGTRVRLRIRDRFELGGVAARLCIRRSGAPRICRAVRIRRGRSSADYTLRARRRGVWRVTLTTAHQLARAAVAVGVEPPPDAPALPVLLTTGDSMMQSVDAELLDLLSERADIRSDTKVGGGLTKLVPVDWTRLPARQLRRFRPAATVVFMGANDGFAMRTPDGTEVVCCGEAWVAEYARRARRAMKGYREGGRAVIWLNVPVARDSRRNPAVHAVNAALRRAVAGLDRAALLDMAELFTPGGVYRDSMTVGGRRVRVRQSDGVHLSADGASIAARAVARKLEQLGVV